MYMQATSKTLAFQKLLIISLTALITIVNQISVPIPDQPTYIPSGVVLYLWVTCWNVMPQQPHPVSLYKLGIGHVLSAHVHNWAR